MHAFGSRGAHSCFRAIGRSLCGARAAGSVRARHAGLLRQNLDSLAAAKIVVRHVDSWKANVGVPTWAGEGIALGVLSTSKASKKTRRCRGSQKSREDSRSTRRSSGRQTRALQAECDRNRRRHFLCRRCRRCEVSCNSVQRRQSQRQKVDSLRWTEPRRKEAECVHAERRSRAKGRRLV